MRTTGRSSAAAGAASRQTIPPCRIRGARTDHIAWTIDVPGRGWSSPIVWGDHVFVTAAVNAKGSEEPLKPVPSYAGRSVGGPMSGRDIGSSTDQYRWVVSDIDFKSGKGPLAEHRSYGRAGRVEAQKNSYASETPATDGERVYVYSGNAGLFAFDMNGKSVWSKPMGPFKVRSGWGPPPRPSSTRIASISSTTTTISRLSRLTTPGPAQRSGR
jgi:hypothetical protein